MSNKHLKIIVGLTVFVFVTIGAIFVQIKNHRTYIDAIDKKCEEHLLEAKNGFTAFLSDNGLEHYIYGCDNLYAFLSFYEMSADYQVENYLAIVRARLVLAGSKDAITDDRITRLINGLEILINDINDAPGYTELDIFTNYGNYHE